MAMCWLTVVLLYCHCIGKQMLSPYMHSLTQKPLFARQPLFAQWLLFAQQPLVAQHTIRICKKAQPMH